MKIYKDLTPSNLSAELAKAQRQQFDSAAMQQFDTGATRDADAGKLDYEGFLSPAVLQRFAQYMHQHRTQANGQLRDSDNWQRGVPLASYRKSLIRHVVELWGLWRGGAGGGAQQELLCAVMFNAMGMLHELLREGNRDPWR